MILDRFRVTDRVAVITGAGRGIGRGIAIALAEAGADVVLAARRENTLQEVASIVEKAGRRALVVPTDALVPEHLDRLVERSLEEFGGVDFLVNNVGGTLPGPALQCTDDEFNKSFNFNVTTALHLSRMLAPSMPFSANSRCKARHSLDSSLKPMCSRILPVPSPRIPESGQRAQDPALRWRSAPRDPRLPRSD